jgi:hypothetical protein
MVIELGANFPPVIPSGGHLVFGQEVFNLVDYFMFGRDRKSRSMLKMMFESILVDLSAPPVL